MRLARRFLCDQRGTAAVEMALILPVAVGILLVTFDAAYYMLCEQRAVQSVRNAARYAARLDLSNYACPGGTFTGPEATLQNMVVTGSPDGTAPLIKGWRNNDVSLSVACTSDQGGIYEANGGEAPTVRISTSFAFPSLMQEFGLPAPDFQIAATAESPVVGI